MLQGEPGQKRELPSALGDAPCAPGRGNNKSVCGGISSHVNNLGRAVVQSTSELMT